MEPNDYQWGQQPDAIFPQGQNPYTDQVAAAPIEPEPMPEQEGIFPPGQNPYMPADQLPPDEPQADPLEDFDPDEYFKDLDDLNQTSNPDAAPIGPTTGMIGGNSSTMPQPAGNRRGVIGGNSSFIPPDYSQPQDQRILGYSTTGKPLYQIDGKTRDGRPIYTTKTGRQQIGSAAPDQPQQAAPGQNSQAGDDWMPIQGFQASPSQRRMMEENRRNGSVDQATYEAARADRVAQEGGMPYAVQVHPAEIDQARQIAERMTDARLPPQVRALKVQQNVDLQVEALLRRRENSLQSFTRAKEHREQEGARAAAMKESNEVKMEIANQQMKIREENIRLSEERLKFAQERAAGRANQPEFTPANRLSIEREARNAIAKEYADAQKKALKDDDIPEHLRTPEARMAAAEERAEQIMLPKLRDPEAVKQFGEIQGQIGPRLESAAPELLDKLEEMLTDPNRHGLTRANALKLRAKIMKLRERGQQAQPQGQPQRPPGQSGVTDQMRRARPVGPTIQAAQ